MIARLKNQELDLKIKQLAKQEREILREVLEHIKEADTRRLYLDFAHSSLFAYLVEGCGYSAGAAQRRIDAARLLLADPKLAQKIETGEINLAQVSMLQKSIRQINKTKRVSNEEKRILLEKISYKSPQETQKLIAQELNISVKENPKETHQKDESVRLEITLTKEQWRKLEKARDLASNVTHSNDWSVLFEYLAEKLIRQKVGSSVAVKKQVLQRDERCQYHDKNTGKVCNSRWNLQVDHREPRWANGTNEKSNLRILCQKHNLHIYRQQAGIRFIT